MIILSHFHCRKIFKLGFVICLHISFIFKYAFNEIIQQTRGNKMSNSFRRDVLQSFKALHKARQAVFKGDTFALKEGRKKINEEYRKCKNVENTGSIEELVNYARAMEQELRTCVIQAKEVKPGLYQAEIRSETVKLENTPFNEEACLNAGKNKTSSKSRKKCGS